MKFVYLHGFASGVESGKARFLRDRFSRRGVTLEIPDLTAGDFENLTITRQLDVVCNHLSGVAACVIGSSMGGYLASLYASLHPEVHKLVLLAPAFWFPQWWPERLGPEKSEARRSTGYMEVFYYGESANRQISWKIMEDAQHWPGEPSFTQPALIFHGTRDDVVPADVSMAFAESHPNVTLRLLDSDHQLTDSVEVIWEETEAFVLG